MKKSIGAVVGGVCVGAVVIYSWRLYMGFQKARKPHLPNEDMNCSNHSPVELIEPNMTDLNDASAKQIADLGLSAESVERVLENRPYRNKLELLSRMVLSQDEYSAIKHKVSAAGGQDSVKVA
jgi:hypothetical protein